MRRDQMRPGQTKRDQARQGEVNQGRAEGTCLTWDGRQTLKRRGTQEMDSAGFERCKELRCSGQWPWQQKWH